MAGTVDNAGGAGSEQSGPLVLIRGEATDEEVAALVAVLQASAAAVPMVEPAAAPVPSWGAPARKLRVTFPHGPGGWRASGLPR